MKGGAEVMPIDSDGDRLATKADLAEVLADLTRRLVLALVVQMAIFTALAAALC